jgi:hypothetical protein
MKFWILVTIISSIALAACQSNTTSVTLTYGELQPLSLPVNYTLPFTFYMSLVLNDQPTFITVSNFFSFLRVLISVFMIFLNRLIWDSMHRSMTRLWRLPTLLPSESQVLCWIRSCGCLLSPVMVLNYNSFKAQAAHWMVHLFAERYKLVLEAGC